ncbi:aquaporin-like protein [Guyanagaster necrorhizus]|uniref:Aquaporin-like protein n=1 Tax=Guyanagaster necrorhizus TaxID=856835 RepID=A0A9P7VGJ6_9AGAR|nr:aquaporin-like protein [Guyanagaster necrorhizus MCA 3950]KAG7440596.1 aquaporin-like protein [Guyanagaster necrorhizus MCA 3950]
MTIHGPGTANPNVVHLADFQPPAKIFTIWERHRHAKARWLAECFAEFVSVGSTAPWVVGNAIGETGLSSIFQIGVAYASGIVFAICFCSGTSGGHFNPSVTIACCLFKDFPKMKGLRYIVAQILGGYVACLLIYVQYKHLLDEAEGAMMLAGTFSELQFTPRAPAGIFGLYLLPGAKMGQVFLNEFVADVMLAIVIWGSIDPTNILVPPQAKPYVIALGYAVAIWGFSFPGLAANAARDVGGRLAALTIYGRKASGGSYAALAALTNVPATVVGVLLYELFLADSQRAAR